jgi:hypothetical protein
LPNKALGLYVPSYYENYGSEWKEAEENLTYMNGADVQIPCYYNEATPTEGMLT